MKIAKLLIAFTAGILIFATAFGADKNQKPKADGINWYRYDEGVALAKKKDKHVFIDFTTSWCGWCKKMEKETFSDKRVIDLLENDFVPVRVDGDSKEILEVDGYKISEKNLTRSEFGVSSYPSLWFLKSDGSKLGNLRGYQTTDKLLKALNYVKDYRYDTTRAQTP